MPAAPRPPPHHGRERHAQTQHPGCRDEQLGPVGGQLVLPLHDDEEAVHADDEQDGHTLQDEQPVQHDGRAAEHAAEAPVGGGHGDSGEGHAEQREHDVGEGQRGQQQVDGRPHGGLLVDDQAHDGVPQEADGDHEDHDGGQGDAEGDRHEGCPALRGNALGGFLHAARLHVVTALWQALVAERHGGHAGHARAS